MAKSDSKKSDQVLEAPQPRTVTPSAESAPDTSARPPRPVLGTVAERVVNPPEVAISEAAEQIEQEAAMGEASPVAPPQNPPPGTSSVQTAPGQKGLGEATNPMTELAKQHQRRSEQPEPPTTEPLVLVTPTRNGVSRIGQATYYYVKGKPKKVPYSVAEVLYNGGAIHPPALPRITR